MASNTYTQENRLMAIETPLGGDVLLLQALTGHEAISRLFTFELELLSTNDSISFSDIVGQRVSIRIKLAEEGEERYINGFVSRFAQSGSDQRFTYYQAEVVPWLWFLTRTAGCRIFQNQSVTDVIEKVFTDLGYSDYRLSLQGTYDPLEYCVQYRETAFNFVTRLMEQYGIFYFFEHDKDKHTLVMGDSPSVHQPCPHQPKAQYDIATGNIGVEDVVTGWRLEQELRTGKYSLTDYNFETPSTSLLASEPTVFTVNDNTKYEIYDYPGEYDKKSQGKVLAKTRMQEEEASHLVASGTSVCRAFTSGAKFDLEEHYRKDMNTSYVLTEVQHNASAGESYMTGEEGQGEQYSNHFTCIPANVPFRPPRLTLRPVIQGVQPALVVGRSGEEILTDKYGRVKVQFYWDRDGKRDENSSCWVRVSQPWGGKNWGAMFIPRIGQEVIVEFVEGDPDHPIITGRVYNAEQMPPGTLPHNQHSSGFRTRSTKGAGEHDANVLAWDDTKGAEMFYMRAEKDLMMYVEHDRMTHICHDEGRKVDNNRTTSIGNDESTKIGHDKTLMVMNNRSTTITGTDSEKVAQSQTNQIGMSQTTTVGGTRATSVAGAETHSVAGMLSLTCGGAMTVTVGGVTTITSGGLVMITAPVVLINGVLVVTQAIVSPVYTPGLGNFI